ncbi:MAG: LOG family protein, partial [Ignavibacterium sp.]
IFGSSKPKEGEDEYQLAYELGHLLGNRNYDVCTGGYYGIMEAVSKGAVEEGSNATGVTVIGWSRKGNSFLTDEIKCDSLFERLNQLIEIGDAYVILQGGTGTLLELAAVWELANKGSMDHKPIACHSSMWQGIISIMNIQMKKEGRNTELVKTFDYVEEIVNYLTEHLDN